MLSEEKSLELAEFFRVFGDSTRIRIINSLFEKERCVNEISEMLNTSQSAVSHQLKILRQARLVKQRRDAKQIYYSLDDCHIEAIFNQGLDHISEEGK